MAEIFAYSSQNDELIDKGLMPETSTPFDEQIQAECAEQGLNTSSEQAASSQNADDPLYQALMKKIADAASTGQPINIPWEEAGGKGSGMMPEIPEIPEMPKEETMEIDEKS